MSRHRVAEGVARVIVAGVFVFEGARAIARGSWSAARDLRRVYRETRDRVEQREEEP